MIYVKCEECNENYESLFQSDEQNFSMLAMECAAEYQKSTNRVFGHYGSKIIDLQVWKFTKEVDYPNNAILCDKCLQNFINDNSLVYVKDYNLN